jgi:CRP-like cAMP-binding protein
MTTAQQQQAIAYYQRVIRKMPPFTSFRIHAHIRLGKLYAEAGNTESAIGEFSDAAAQYLHNGALVKAIAANAMILELDPARKDVHADLSALYFKHGEIPLTLDESFQREHGGMTLKEKLASVPLFSYLAEEERQKIAEFLTPIRVKKGAVIIQEGDIGDCMYLIKSGEVEVYTLLLEEHQHDADVGQDHLHLATLKSGDFFGEQALIAHEPRNATIIALTDAELLRFSKPDLDAVVKSYPRVGELLEKYHHQRNNATVNSLKSAFHNA